ncbi:MAG: hypothetical protein H7233_00610 [Pseudorhodobacter sp.]|nr:hypothetical protein [Frankiaceae bacterium]
MGADPRQALAVLRVAADDGRLDALCERHGVRVLTVFGSAIRPDGEPHDLDVAVLFAPTPAADLLALLDDLARLTGSDDLDVMVLDHAGPVARERALVGCVALYESGPGVYARAQIAAVGERMDTAWLRDFDLETMRA